MPVGCAGIGVVLTLVSVVRSITSTAPGSAPIDSCVM